MIQKLLEEFTKSGNQFLSGGLVIMLVGSLGMWLKGIPSKIWNLFLKHCTVHVDIKNNSECFTWISLWLNNTAYSKRARKVSLSQIEVGDDNKKKEKKVIMIPGMGQHWFLHNKKPVWLNRFVDNFGGGGLSDDIASTMAAKETISLRTFGRTRIAITSIIEEARQQYMSASHNMTEVFKYDGWNNWNLGLRAKRPLSSVFLPPSGKNISQDMRRFLQSEDLYAKLGIPYHRGYLFYGPPGTGKSSAALALAGEHNLPVYFLNLASLTDSTLEKGIQALPSDHPFILLCEDIDVVGITREAEKPKLSLGTLLNVFDGVAAPNNAIFIMTTNFPDKIDPALTRSGRVDVKVNFDYATQHQINQMLKHYNLTTEQEDAIVLELPTIEEAPVTLATLQEKLKSYLYAEAA